MVITITHVSSDGKQMDSKTRTFATANLCECTAKKRKLDPDKPSGLTEPVTMEWNSSTHDLVGKGDGQARKRKAAFLKQPVAKKLKLDGDEAVGLTSNLDNDEVPMDWTSVNDLFHDQTHNQKKPSIYEPLAKKRIHHIKSTSLINDIMNLEVEILTESFRKIKLPKHGGPVVFGRAE